jgi:HNH endonuclease
MSAVIPHELRARVAAQARHRCGYCLTETRIIGALMEVDHIIPRSLGGLTEEANLWLACSPCNQHKSDRIAALDPMSGERARLFDPRRQTWSEHFAWSTIGDRIIGLTATGRATVVALQLNRRELVRARQRWVSVGWHPPAN